MSPVAQLRQIIAPAHFQLPEAREKYPLRVENRVLWQMISLPSFYRGSLEVRRVKLNQVILKFHKIRIMTKLLTRRKRLRRWIGDLSLYLLLQYRFMKSSHHKTNKSQSWHLISHSWSTKNVSKIEVVYKNCLNLKSNSPYDKGRKVFYHLYDSYRIQCLSQTIHVTASWYVPKHRTMTTTSVV
jgi:hypothetical protein